MPSLTVLLVGKGPPDSGGISATLVGFQRALRPEFTVDLLNLTRSGDYVAGVLSFGNVTRTVTDFFRVLKAAHSYDVVYLHSSFVPAVTAIRAGMLLFAARLRRARTVLHVHGGPLADWATNPLRSIVLRLCLLPADEVIAVSKDLADALPSPGVRVIPNGVDTDSFSGAERNARSLPVVLYVGLVTRRKGVADLIQASAILRRRSIGHRLVIVGGRPDEGGAEQNQVMQLASGEEEFVGPVPHTEIPRYYAEADVFCLPSWFEAMPLSVLEAMAAGLPVVASRVGEIPEVVTDDFGILVDPQDPDGLADALELVLRDPQRRKAMGERARELAESSYSIEATVARVRTTLLSAARQARSRP